MANFFENLDPDAAAELDDLSRLIYELRENRNAVLDAHGAADAADLLQRIQTGDLPEHPGYEHYLAVRILADTLGTVRAAVAERLQEVRRQ
jgi:hypothetical protein